MNDILRFAERQTERAWQILEQSRVVELWTEAGAECRVVGSLRTGLLCRHRDIDLHVYSQGITTAMSFGVMARIATDPHVTEIRCENGLHTDERCLSWHVWWLPDGDGGDGVTGGEPWQIDIIHIESGSRYDGFFERVADRIAERMTDEQHRMILRLKYETPEEDGIHGIEYCQAVIEGGVTSPEELRRWVHDHRRRAAQEYWMP